MKIETLGGTTGKPMGHQPQARCSPLQTKLKCMLSKTSINSIEVKNIDNLQDLLPTRLQIRALDRIRIVALQLPFLKRIGLDIYATATKL